MIIPKDAVIVSKDGEIIGELKKGDKVLKATSIRILQEKAANLAYKPNGWQSVYVEALQTAIMQLSEGAEKKTFFILISNLRRNTNKVAFQNGKPVTYQYIAEATGHSPVTIRRILSKFKKMGIIVKYNRTFVFNPYIAWSGKYISKGVTALFKNTEYEQLSGNTKM